MSAPRPELLGLTLQQPWAELILRGIKTMEIRSLPVAPGKTIYLYASRRSSTLLCARDALKKFAIKDAELPRGKVVGSAFIAECRPATTRDARHSLVDAELLQGCYSWILEDPRRFPEPLDSVHVPYGMWFYPFRAPPPTPRRRGRS